MWSGLVSSKSDDLEFDLQIIEDLAGGDSAVVSELISTFLRHTIDSIGQVRAALAAGEFSQAARIAHTCIGFTGALGMDPLLPNLRALERASRAGDREQTEGCLERWQSEVEQAMSFLFTRMSGKE